MLTATASLIQTLPLYAGGKQIGTARFTHALIMIDYKIWDTPTGQKWSYI